MILPFVQRDSADFPFLSREQVTLWLCGSLLGFAAYLPSVFHLATRAGWWGWSAALVCSVVAAPLHVVVDLTFPLWGYLGKLGAWATVALTACLYYGTVAIVLGSVWRRSPWSAIGFGAAGLALHFILYFLWRMVSAP